MIWHIKGDRELTSRYVSEALATGKTRRSDAFNWTPGVSLGGMYEPISEHVTRPAGGGQLAAGNKRGATAGCRGGSWGRRCSGCGAPSAAIPDDLRPRNHDPKAALATLKQKEQAGKVRVSDTVDTGTQAFFLAPISPFIRKEDWHAGTK